MKLKKWFFFISLTSLFQGTVFAESAFFDAYMGAYSTYTQTLHKNPKMTLPERKALVKRLFVPVMQVYQKEKIEDKKNMYLAISNAFNQHMEIIYSKDREVSEKELARVLRLSKGNPEKNLSVQKSNSDKKVLIKGNEAIALASEKRKPASRQMTTGEGMVLSGAASQIRYTNTPPTVRRQGFSPDRVSQEKVDAAGAKEVQFNR